MKPHHSHKTRLKYSSMPLLFSPRVALFFLSIVCLVAAQTMTTTATISETCRAENAALSDPTNTELTAAANKFRCIKTHYDECTQVVQDIFSETMPETCHENGGDYYEAFVEFNCVSANGEAYKPRFTYPLCYGASCSADELEAELETTGLSYLASLMESAGFDNCTAKAASAAPPSLPLGSCIMTMVAWVLLLVALVIGWPA